tara:strand:+ start:38623 stop:39324 length:702 start_codon:yes stop_codon:yes gene_type:complete
MKLIQKNSMQKFTTFFIALILGLFGLNLSAQDTTSVNQSNDSIEGKVELNAITIKFNNMVYKDIPISGVLKPNMSMTKYQVDITGKALSLNGIIHTKELKTVFELTFDGKPITGEMKIPLAGENYKWNVDFLNSSITGGIKLNLAHTKATFNLKSPKYNVTGEIKDKGVTVFYDIKINDKSVKGKIKNQINNDLTYKLSLDHLNKEEITLFFLIESVRLIALDKESADKFQNR